MRNAGLDEAQAAIKIARRTINNLRYADDTTFMAESEELKSLLMTAKEESEKVGLKLIQKTEIMASGPITSWQIDGETVANFISGAPKSLQMVTAVMKFKNACSLEENLFVCISFFSSFGMVLLPAFCTMSRTSVHSSSGILSDLVP